MEIIPKAIPVHNNRHHYNENSGYFIYSNRINIHIIFLLWMETIPEYL